MQYWLTVQTFSIKMRVVDLFCGCGGLTLGFEKAGYDVVAGFDFWDDAIAVYKKNFKHPVIKQDLSDVEASVSAIREYHPDMIIGGPPCQDFSSAGKRDEDNGRGDLTLSYAQIISAIRPMWFVMENVERILKTNKLVQAKKIYRESGYGMTQMVLDASLCGVPQKRKRFVLIGKLGAQDGFMQNELTSRMSKQPMTVADYFGNRLGVEYYYRHPRSYVRRGIFSIHEPSATIRGVNRPMPNGYQLRPNDPVKSKEGIRALTTLERSMIQTFPEDFVFLGNKTNQEQMIGNAVPVKLAQYVGDSISRYISKEQIVAEKLSQPTMFDSKSWIQLDLFETLEKYPDYIVDNQSSFVSDGSELQYNANRNKCVLVCLVTDANTEPFIARESTIYYTGKRFPQEIDLDKMCFFVPYIKHKGIRDLYIIRRARVGCRREGQPDEDKKDLRLVFEIEYVNQLYPDYRHCTLNIWNTYKDSTIEELMSGNL